MKALGAHDRQSPSVQPDKTVYHNLGLEGFGGGANLVAVDVKDGKLVRIRPAHYSDYYSAEDLNAWKLVGANGKTFEPGMKSLTPAFPLVYKNRTFSANRVPFPMKRIDWDPSGERHPETRGISKYERISWDEALEIVASEIKRVHDVYGPHSILCMADGHGESKNIHASHGCMAPLLEACGGFTSQNRNPDSWEGWYWGAKHVWGMDPVGQNVYASNTAQDIAQNADALLYWGCDLETNTWAWGGHQASRLAFWFSECGVKSIAIAPDCNYTTAVHADKWIPVLPNTDAALQLAIAYVWWKEGTYDKEYIATHTDGFDWFVYYLSGDEDGIPKTPEWAEGLCGVPAYRIKALARYWAKHNVSIGHCNGGSYIRSAFSHEPARLEVYLMAMQGVGAPGRTTFKFIEWVLFGSSSHSPVPPSEFIPSTASVYNGLMIGKDYGAFVPKTMVHKALRGEELEWYGRGTAANARTDQFDKHSFPLPGEHGIKMVWADSAAFATSLNGGNEFLDALKTPTVEFYLMEAPWFENEARYADLILPVSTKFEVTDIGNDNDAGQWCAIIYEQAAIEPAYESKSDWEIACEVAKRLERFGGRYEDLHSIVSHDKTVEELVEFGYENCGMPKEKQDFQRFKSQGYELIPTKKNWEDDPVGLRMFYDDPASAPMSTPTGKIEFYSTALADNFPNDKVRGPVAHWIESGDGHDDRKGSERAKQFPFLVVSNHPRWRVHAEFNDATWLREIETCKVLGPDGYAYEPLWLNPLDAAALGLKNGDVAKVFNERGAVLGGVRVTERIMQGVVYMDHGANADEIVPGTGGLDRGGCINLICPTATSSSNATGEVTSGYLVGVEGVDVFELAEKYPDAFTRDGNYTWENGMSVNDFIAETTEEEAR